MVRRSPFAPPETIKNTRPKKTFTSRRTQDRNLFQYKREKTRLLSAAPFRKSLIIESKSRLHSALVTYKVLRVLFWLNSHKGFPHQPELDVTNEINKLRLTTQIPGVYLCIAIVPCSPPRPFPSHYIIRKKRKKEKMRGTPKH